MNEMALDSTGRPATLLKGISEKMFNRLFLNEFIIINFISDISQLLLILLVITNHSFVSVTLSKEPLTQINQCLLSGFSALPSNISVAQSFFETYKDSIKNKNYEEATQIKAKLIDLVANNIDTTAEDMRNFGEKLREKKLFLEAILIFDASSTLSLKIEDAQRKLKMIQFCVQGIKETIIAMIREDVHTKVVVKDHVIPLMRDKLHDIDSTPSVNEQKKCLQVSWVLHRIEFSQMLIEQLKEREQTLREGLKRLDEVLGENKIKHRIYGHLLNNLGNACDMTSRHEEAASFFEQSIDAKKAATDYDSDEERKGDIELSEKSLSIVQQNMK